MLLKRLLILSGIMVAFVFAKAQEVELYLVTIKGVVTEIETGEPIVYANVINPRTHSGTTTNADGFFSMTMLTDDTLTISAIGFVTQDFNINEFPPQELYNIVLKPVRYQIGEVTITEQYRLGKKLGLPQAKPLDIPIELRGSDFNEKPPWYAALVNPIAVLYYHTSKEEKRKRETLNIIKDNKEWLKFSRYHNLETIEKITGLKGTEADKFMLYCNLHNRLSHNASQMEIEFQIMDFFFKYKKEQEAKADSVR